VAVAAVAAIAGCAGDDNGDGASDDGSNDGGSASDDDDTGDSDDGDGPRHTHFEFTEGAQYEFDVTAGDLQGELRWEVTDVSGDQVR